MYSRGNAGAGSSSPAVLSPLRDDPLRKHVGGVGADARFTPNSFQYNTRVAAALLPCMLVLLGAGGTPVIATLVVGLSVSYILDALQLKQGAFAGIWSTLFATSAALILVGVGFGPHIPLLLSLLIAGTYLHLVFLSGVWISLQFKWLQLEHPSVVLSLERVLFACCPFTATAIQTWGAVSAFGIALAPFYLLPISAYLYWMFCLPLPSSFRTRASSHPLPEENLILGKLESSVHTCFLLFFPLLFHFAVHHAMVLHSWDEVCDHLLLFFLPLLFQLFASTRGALWWLLKDPRQLHRIRVLNGGVSVAVILGCLESRVIFTSFSHYIHLPPPLNYILVSLALYGGALVTAVHFLGLLKGAAHKALVTSVLLVSAVAGALVLGMPLKIIPAPAIAAYYLSQFLLSGALAPYFVFVAATVLSATWFLIHTFWFLDADLGGLPLKTLCYLLLASLLLALAVPGVALLPRAQVVVGGVFVLQAVIVCRVENRLFNLSGGEAGLYPAYLVLLTSAAGFLAARRLEAANQMGPWATWVGSCLYFAKLPMLVVPSPNVIWASALVMLAATPPLLLYKERSKIGSNMKPWQGIFHALSVGLALFLSRSAVIAAVHTWTGHHAATSLVVGILILATAAACLPIVSQHFAHVQSARRLVVLAVATAVLLMVLEPPFPVVVGEEEVDVDDHQIYGSTARGPTWAAWLLLGTAVATLAAATSALPVAQVPALRLGYSLALGTAAGVYLCAQFLAPLPAVHLLVVACSVGAILFILFTYFPAPWSPPLMPLLFAAFVALLPVTLMLAGVVVVPPGEEEAEGVAAYYDQLAVVEGRQSILALHAALLLLMATVIKLKLALVRVEAGGGGKERLPNVSPFAPKHRAVLRRTNLTQSHVGRKLPADLVWMPAVGNAATVICFGLCLYLNNELTQESDMSIFAIAPILLLLVRDDFLFQGLGDRQRYFPLTVAISGFLFASSGYRVSEEIWYGFSTAGWQSENRMQILWIGKNLALLALTLPNHILVNRYMWDNVRQSNYLLLIFTPLNLPAILMPDFATTRLLAVLGIVCALGQYWASRRVRLQGLRYI